MILDWRQALDRGPGDAPQWGPLEVVILVRPDLVVADDVVALRLAAVYCLRPPGMSGVAVLVRPTVGVPCRMVHPAALNDDVAQLLVVAEHGCLAVDAPALLALAAPLADIAVLDDDVMAAEPLRPIGSTSMSSGYTELWIMSRRQNSRSVGGPNIRNLRGRCPRTPGIYRFAHQSRIGPRTAGPPSQAVRLLLRWPASAQVASPQSPILWPTTRE